MRLVPPERLSDEVAALRRPAERDAAPFLRAFADDPDLGRLIGLEQDPADEDAVLERIRAAPENAETGRALELVIADPRDDSFLGSLVLFRFDERDRRAEVGYWLVPAARGRGVASHAVSLAVTWAFEELDLVRVEMTTTADNLAVDALARRLGFAREGVMRSRAIERGVPVDIVIYAVLRDEWPRRV